MPRVIACDESGYEGEHLVGGVTTVFAHAGTDLDLASAEEVVAELRVRIRSPAQEYKANHLLRTKHRGALEWTLQRLAGRASVHLVDKAFLLARTLDEIAPPLVQVEHVLRARTGREVAVTTAALRAVAPEIADAVAERRMAELAAPPPFPALDPLPAAIGATVARWSAAGPVELVHDRQTTLSAERIAALQAAHPALAGLTLVPSRSDARVQVADFVAGVAYRIAADALAGRGDPALLALLKPYVLRSSVWRDEASGAALGLP